MLFHSTEMNIQFVKVLQQSSKRCSFGHLRKGINIFWEALATITELAVRTGDVGVCVVDIAGEEDAGVYFAPIGPHLLAVLAAGVEVGHLIGAKNVVHVLGEFRFQWSHYGEFLAYENLSKQFLSTSKYHGLFVEVLNKRAFGKKLRHIANLMASLLGEHLASARKDGGTNEYRYVRKVGDELLHQRQVLRSIIFCGNMNLKECNVNLT